MPWAFAIRPTTSCITRLPAAVDVHEVDPNPATAERGHHRTQRLGGAAGPADHLAEVVRVDPDLEHPALPALDAGRP